MKRYLVLYHANCPDGFCAAWVAWRQFGEQADYLPVQHGQAPPDVTGRFAVYLLDFCYPAPVLHGLAAQVQYVTVLDHHRSRVPDMGGPHYRPGDEDRPQGYGHGRLFCRYCPDRSGGRMAWEHFYQGTPAPWLVDYTEDRDLWRWKLAHSRAVSAWLASSPWTFSAWDEYARILAGSAEWGGLVQEGHAILRYQAQQVEAICANAREVEVGGHRILAACTSVLFSDVAGKLAEGRPFGAAWFVRADGKRQWSLRSREGGIDVSVVAEALGGGGHRNAAGFEEGD